VTTSAFFSFLHFVAVFGIVGTLAVEWTTLSAAPTHREARRMQVCDRWYGLFALAILAVGFLRVFYFEKGEAFYFRNPFFHAKLGLFAAVGLLSIYPTVRFRKWRRQMADGRAPVVAVAEHQALRTVIVLELLLIAGMVACAALMARGIGLKQP
jgi:putative membrane protein